LSGSQKGLSDPTSMTTIVSFFMNMNPSKLLYLMQELKLGHFFSHLPTHKKTIGPSTHPAHPSYLLIMSIYLPTPHPFISTFQAYHHPPHSWLNLYILAKPFYPWSNFYFLVKSLYCPVYI
jgi:hypothetical protein